MDFRKEFHVLEFGLGHPKFPMGQAGLPLVVFVAALSLAFSKSTKNMSTVGAVVVVIGLESSAYRCTCEHHNICGTIVKHDTLLRFEKQLVEDGK